jgi:hypothetical protein
MAPEPGLGRIEYDLDKVDEITLALLWRPVSRTLTVYEPGRTKTGKRWIDFAQGLLSDPKSKAKSVGLSEEGEKRSRELFAKHFSLKH